MVRDRYKILLCQKLYNTIYNSIRDTLLYTLSYLTIKALSNLNRTYRSYLRSLVDVCLEIPLRLHIKVALLRSGHVELLQQLPDVAIGQRQRSLLNWGCRYRWHPWIGPGREPTGGLEILFRFVGGELPATPLEPLLLLLLLLLLSLLEYAVKTSPWLLILLLLLLHRVPAPEDKLRIL